MNDINGRGADHNLLINSEAEGGLWGGKNWGTRGAATMRQQWGRGASKPRALQE